MPELSEKHREVKGMPPEEPKETFDEMVSDYRYAATLRHGKPYVSYNVLADMVKAGWRCTAKESQR